MLILLNFFFSTFFRLVSKIKRTPVFLRNNEEEPYESILQANFTDLTHKGLKNMNITETYAIQGYAWFVFNNICHCHLLIESSQLIQSRGIFFFAYRPNLLRGNSLVLVNSQGSGKTFAYLPVICSTVQVGNFFNKKKMLKQIQTFDNFTAKT